jgi:hypothetical protein
MYVCMYVCHVCNVCSACKVCIARLKTYRDLACRLTQSDSESESESESESYVVLFKSKHVPWNESESKHRVKHFKNSTRVLVSESKNHQAFHTQSQCEFQM